ncbi:MAG: hypothetical protein JWO42_3174 [Chloroflexi bacterium]|nr:hypothetical protein [Chloroflexota bacterium]
MEPNYRSRLPGIMLLRHGITLMRGRVLRWRLETFGIYMPSLPLARPWWRVNSRALGQLLQHSGAYAAWLIEMETLTERGPGGWWDTRVGSGESSLRSYIDRENSDPGLDTTGQEDS